MEVHNAEVAFLNLQTEEPKLVPIKDVRTRWNTTFLILRRGKRLRPLISSAHTTASPPNVGSRGVATNRLPSLPYETFL